MHLFIRSVNIGANIDYEGNMSTLRDLWVRIHYLRGRDSDYGEDRTTKMYAISPLRTPMPIVG